MNSCNTLGSTVLNVNRLSTFACTSTEKAVQCVSQQKRQLRSGDFPHQQHFGQLRHFRNTKSSSMRLGNILGSPIPSAFKISEDTILNATEKAVYLERNRMSSLILLVIVGAYVATYRAHIEQFESHHNASGSSLPPSSGHSQQIRQFSKLPS